MAIIYIVTTRKNGRRKAICSGENEKPTDACTGGRGFYDAHRSVMMLLRFAERE